MVQLSKLTLLSLSGAASDNSLVEEFFRDTAAQVYFIRTAEDLFDTLRSRPDTVHGVVLPLKLASGRDAITLCEQLRLIPVSSELPIIFLLGGDMEGSERALYEEGADLVISPPYTPAATYSQIQALAERYLRFRQDRASRKSSTALITPVVEQVLEAVREGVFLFNTHGEISYANIEAQRMFGLGVNPDQREVEWIENQFESVLREASSSSEGYRTQKQLIRVDKLSLLLDLLVAPLANEDGVRVGSLVSLTDGEQPQRTQHFYEYLVGLERFGLQTAAGASHFLGASSSGMILRPLQRIEESIQSEKRGTDLNALVSTLVEYFDYAIPQNLVMKVNLRDGEEVDTRPGDLTRVLGALFLHAVKFAGSQGEVRIMRDSRSSTSSQLCVILQAITCLHFPVESLAGADEVFSPAPFDQPKNNQLNPLGWAIELAGKNRIQVDYRWNEREELRFRLKLPMSAQEAASDQKDPPNE